MPAAASPGIESGNCVRSRVLHLDVRLQRARSAQRVRDQAAMLGALEQRMGLVDVAMGWNLELCEGAVAGELRSLADELEHAFDTALELQPLEVRRAAHGAKGEDEAVGE